MVDEEGGSFIAAGTGSAGMPQITEPPLGFSYAVYRGGDSWSAEMEINESLLDGWNHPAHIRIGEFWLTYIGNDYGMPQSSWYDQPQTWAPAFFGTVLPAPLNRAPVSDAGPDQARVINDPVSLGLDGIGSFDPDGDPLEYTWTQLSGPIVTLDDDNITNPKFTAPAITTTIELQFQLVVSDSKLESAPDTVNVTLRKAWTTPPPTPTPTPVPDKTQLVDYLLGKPEGVGYNTNQDAKVDIADLIWLILNE
jgi:hypothetical protein